MQRKKSVGLKHGSRQRDFMVRDRMFEVDEEDKISKLQLSTGMQVFLVFGCMMVVYGAGAIAKGVYDYNKKMAFKVETSLSSPNIDKSIHDIKKACSELGTFDIRTAEQRELNFQVVTDLLESGDLSLEDGHLRCKEGF